VRWRQRRRTPPLPNLAEPFHCVLISAVLTVGLPSQQRGRPFRPSSAHCSCAASQRLQLSMAARMCKTTARVLASVQCPAEQCSSRPISSRSGRSRARTDIDPVPVCPQYLKWRGKLHDREAPLFLTYRREPYVDNGRSWGSQNKTGFNAAKRRAAAALIEAADREAVRLRKRGRPKAAKAVLERARGGREAYQPTHPALVPSSAGDEALATRPARGDGARRLARYSVGHGLQP
jgi:hypothetical protein